LVIELDGAVHTNQQEYDTIRTHELETYGYRIIRFDNQRVLNDLDAVLDEIYQASLPFSQHWEKGSGDEGKIP